MLAPVRVVERPRPRGSALRPRRSPSAQPASSPGLRSHRDRANLHPTPPDLVGRPRALRGARCSCGRPRRPRPPRSGRPPRGRPPGSRRRRRVRRKARAAGATRARATSPDRGGHERRGPSWRSPPPLERQEHEPRHREHHERDAPHAGDRSESQEERGSPPASFRARPTRTHRTASCPGRTRARSTGPRDRATDSTGRRDRHRAGARNPKTAVDAADRRTRAVHPSSPNSRIQYRTSPKYAMPNAAPSPSPRRGRAARTTHRNGIGARKAIQPASTGGRDSDRLAPLSAATSREPPSPRRSDLRRSPGRASSPCPSAGSDASRGSTSGM